MERFSAWPLHFQVNVSHWVLEAGFKALVRPITPPTLTTTTTTTVCSASCMSPRPRLNIPSVGYMLEKRLRAPDMG